MAWNEDFHQKRVHIAWRSKLICDAIMSQFRFGSVIDVGCSIGEFVKEFLDRNIDAYGTELNESVLPFLKFPKKRLMLFDITQPFSPSRSYDLALCFMVIGRIPRESWQVAADNLARLSSRLITVVEDEKAWRRNMEKSGYVYHIGISNDLRIRLQLWKNKTAVRSFYNHIQVFEREEK